MAPRLHLWLQLIRWKNLLIIFLTQLLLWVCVIRPAVLDLPHVLGPKNFLLLSCSTIFIAAAGYIINDYFDIRIDAINRPEKVILEKFLHRRNAILLHSFLNLFGLFLAFLVARQVHRYDWLLLQLACTLLLWLYSTHYKRQFLVGNIVVAMLTAFSIFITWLYEPALDSFGWHWPRLAQKTNPIFIIIAYTFFAFMLTWIREIVKDMEDYIGDEAEGCKTMPIVWGLGRTVRFAQFLSLLTVLVVAGGVAFLFFVAQWLLAFYCLLAIVLPLALWAMGLSKRAHTSHYATYSSRLKWIMVLGVGALLVHYIHQYA